MAHAKKYVSQGIHLNNESSSIILHCSLTALFLPASNPKSTILERFYRFLHVVANITVPKHSPDKINSLLIHFFPKSVRSRLKAHVSDGRIKVLYLLDLSVRTD